MIEKAERNLVFKYGAHRKLAGDGFTKKAGSVGQDSS
jgi:hypothetical protein